MGRATGGEPQDRTTASDIPSRTRPGDDGTVPCRVLVVTEEDVRRIEVTCRRCGLMVSSLDTSDRGIRRCLKRLCAECWRKDKSEGNVYVAESSEV